MTFKRTLGLTVLVIAGLCLLGFASAAVWDGERGTELNSTETHVVWSNASAQGIGVVDPTRDVYYDSDTDGLTVYEIEKNETLWTDSSVPAAEEMVYGPGALYIDTSTELGVYNLTNRSYHTLVSGSLSSLDYRAGHLLWVSNNTTTGLTDLTQYDLVTNNETTVQYGDLQSYSWSPADSTGPWSVVQEGDTGPGPQMEGGYMNISQPNTGSPSNIRVYRQDNTDADVVVYESQIGVGWKTNGGSANALQFRLEGAWHVDLVGYDECPTGRSVDCTYYGAEWDYYPTFQGNPVTTVTPSHQSGGQQYDVRVVSNFTNQSATLYLDGQEIATKAFSSSVTSAQATEIGYRADNWWMGVFSYNQQEEKRTPVKSVASFSGQDDVFVYRAGDNTLGEYDNTLSAPGERSIPQPLTYPEDMTETALIGAHGFSDLVVPFYAGDDFPSTGDRIHTFGGQGDTFIIPEETGWTKERLWTQEDYGQYTTAQNPTWSSLYGPYFSVSSDSGAEVWGVFEETIQATNLSLVVDDPTLNYSEASSFGVFANQSDELPGEVTQVTQVTSNDTNVVTVENGQLVGRGNGTTNVTAVYTDDNGTTHTDSVSVRGFAPEPESLSIDTNTSIPYGERSSYGVRLVYEDNTTETVTHNTQLVSNDTSVVRVDRPRLVAGDPGVARLTATYENLTTNLSVTVEEPVPSELVVSVPRNVDVESSTDFRVDVVYTNGTVFEVSDATVTIDDPDDLVSLQQGDLVTNNTEGSFVVRASYTAANTTVSSSQTVGVVADYELANAEHLTGGQLMASIVSDLGMIYLFVTLFVAGVISRVGGPEIGLPVAFGMLLFGWPLGLVPVWLVATSIVAMIATVYVTKIH